MISTSTLENFIMTYGYWALLIGTFLEGETILIIGGISAHFGLLELPYVILSAFIGSFSGDQLYYFIGYFKGGELVAKRKGLQRKVDHVCNLLARYRNLSMLGFRFVYGVRMITPFGIGMCRLISTSRFFIFEAAGAGIWSVTISLGGYFFGYALEPFFKNVSTYEMYVIISIAIIGSLLWIIHRIRTFWKL